ncbi:hypothetical protein A7U60_g7595 [Sanghuangporus baumii]|uniref:DUF202 domain-containing protein n=1 Tax=Sanghuangporus baumii TaxID=108892 RepID=A0A9Q5MZQ7_SANBA|nr:hypothetical protein A7U60_g7595 [Sanghuangporus baumii]
MASSSSHPQTETKHEGLLKRSWHAVLQPFSSTALQSLPDTSRRNRDRETRADRIPEGEGDVFVHEYQAISGSNNAGPPPGEGGEATVNEDGTDAGGGGGGGGGAAPVTVRVPKKIPTPIKVEGKVWFANERTWIAYLNIGVLLGTLALALFNASEDAIARDFAYIYAGISVCVVVRSIFLSCVQHELKLFRTAQVYGWSIYQKRITMIRKRDPGHFDQIIGPVIISALLFFAVLANFILRVREIRRGVIPAPRD